MKKLQDHWYDFRTKVLPRGCSNVQLQETRRAFYAGAAACFEYVTTNSKGSDDAGIAALDALMKEFDEFHKGLGTKY